MEFSDKCLILRTGGFREYDVWLRVLSPQCGIFPAFAFGGSKSRRRFCGCLDVLNFVDFRIQYNRRRDYYILQEGSLLRGFRSLKRSGSRLGMAANCLRFLNSLQISSEDAAQVHKILLDSLTALEDEPSPSSFFPLIFKVALVFCIGFRPDMSGCAGCGLSLDRIQNPSFDILGGRVFCSGCKSGARAVVSARNEALVFLHRIKDTGPVDWIRWSPPMRVRQDFLRLVDAFVNCHLQLEN
ncbi:MAG: DNA repair protein RecO [Thermodesulfobacteriota bacterium]